LNLFEGVLRLMKADGSYQDFTYEEYADFLGEHVEPWSYSKFPYARAWGEGLSMDLAAPKGIYRVNTLARLNVCDQINTPLAQAELEEFRARFGRPAQSTMLYHWARLIELVYACERVLEILADPGITDTNVRGVATPGAGRGVGWVEAPRGTLIHDYSTDADGLISRANIIVGTNHNVAPMNMSIRQVAEKSSRKTWSLRKL
jgi:F420-non-reducing hydrogenase large subunit